MEDGGIHIDFSALDVGQELGAGGQATVYEIRGDQTYVFKKYHHAQPELEALEVVAQWRRDLNPQDRSLLDTSAAWPHQIVIDDDRPVGVTIRRAPEHFTFDVRGTQRLRELQYAVLSERSERLGLSVPDLTDRTAIVQHLAEVLDLFDRHHVIHGDMSFKNILWTDTPEPAVSLLDCDSARVGPSDSALTQVTTQHWTDPRVQKTWIAAPDRDSDRLGLAFYRLFFQARGNFTGTDLDLQIPDTPPLPRPTHELLQRSLTMTVPRPAPSEWMSISEHEHVATPETPAQANSVITTDNGTDTKPPMFERERPKHAAPAKEPLEQIDAPRLSSLGTNSLRAGLLAGFIGGLIGIGLFALISTIFIDTSEGPTSSNTEQRRFLLAIVVPVVTGTLITAWPDLTASNIRRAITRGLRSGAISALASVATLFAIGPLYWAIDPSGSRLVGLSIAFAAVSASVGGAIGLLTTKRLAVIGLVAGAIGGALGGAIFHVAGGSTTVAVPPLLLAAPIATATVGGSGGLAERVAKRYWINFVDGPLAGREIILYRETTTIGSGTQADVQIPDPALEPIHLSINTTRGTIETHPNADVEVNGTAITSSHHVQPTDVVVAGRSYFNLSS